MRLLHSPFLESDFSRSKSDRSPIARHSIRDKVSLRFPLEPRSISIHKAWKMMAFARESVVLVHSLATTVGRFHAWKKQEHRPPHVINIDRACQDSRLKLSRASRGSITFVNHVPSRRQVAAVQL